MALVPSLLLVVAAALFVAAVLIRSRWLASSWRQEQMTPVHQIDSLVELIAGLDRASRTQDAGSAGISEWVAQFRPMIENWRKLKSELRSGAGFVAWLRAGMPQELQVEHRISTLQMHANSAVTPLLMRFRGGPVELSPALADDLWRALDIDLPAAEPAGAAFAS